MNKLIASIAAIVLLAAFTGYWWYGQTNAEKAVRHVITEKGLRGALKYNGVSFNPFNWNVTLRNVQIIDSKLADFDLNISGVTIYDVEQEEGAYTRIHFILSGIQFNALDLACKAKRDNSSSVLTQLLAEPAVMLVTLGYQDIQTNIELDYRYALEDTQDSFTVRFAGQHMGKGELSITLEGVPNAWHSAVTGLANGQTQQAVETIGGDLMRNGIKERIRLAEIEISYDDNNLAERYFNYQKARERSLQGQEPLPEDATLENQQIQEVVDKLVEIGFPKGASVDFVETAFAFAKDPDEFRFNADLKDDSELNIARNDLSEISNKDNTRMSQLRKTYYEVPSDVGEIVLSHLQQKASHFDSWDFVKDQYEIKDLNYSKAGQSKLSSAEKANGIQSSWCLLADYIYRHSESKKDWNDGKKLLKVIKAQNGSLKVSNIEICGICQNVANEAIYKWEKCMNR